MRVSVGGDSSSLDCRCSGVWLVHTCPEMTPTCYPSAQSGGPPAGMGEQAVLEGLAPGQETARARHPTSLPQAAAWRTAKCLRSSRYTEE